MTVRNNYRLEFVGGPNDGEVIYQWTKPEPQFVFALETGADTQYHEYQVHWSNAFQGKYQYVGPTDGNH